MDSPTTSGKELHSIQTKINSLTYIYKPGLDLLLWWTLINDFLTFEGLAYAWYTDTGGFTFHWLASSQDCVGVHRLRHVILRIPPPTFKNVMTLYWSTHLVVSHQANYLGNVINYFLLNTHLKSNWTGCPAQNHVIKFFIKVYWSTKLHTHN